MATITFDGEASESFANTMQHFAGWTVEVTPESGEPFTAQLLGSAPETEDYFGVRVRRWDETTGEPTGEPFAVIVSDIEIC